MTLVLGSVNSDAAVVMADCLLRSGRTRCDNEVTKITAVFCADARLGMSFTGLANVGVPRGHRGPAGPNAFRTVEWLGATLIDLGKTDGRMIPTLVALRDRLNLGFPPPEVRTTDRLLILGFIGYRYEAGRALPVVATLGNALPLGADYVGGPQFELAIEHANPVGLLALGRPFAIVESTRLRLAGLISAGRPPAAIAEKGVELIREVARTPAARAAVGELCMSLVIPADPAVGLTFKHHADRPSTRSFLAHQVHVGTGVGTFVLDPSIRGRLPGGSARPIVFRKAPRNAPGPCGSGQNYKLCHGRTP